MVRTVSRPMVTLARKNTLNTLLFRFGIIIFGKNYDLLNVTYRIIFSGIILLTEQHNPLLSEQNKALRCDSAQCAARYELSERRIFDRHEAFSIIHNFSQKIIIRNPNNNVLLIMISKINTFIETLRCALLY